ncbi:nicotinate-nucleotide pyrophosphorylase (carboxylating) [Neobacillus sp. B4I6]|jgi:nicotinate-nucleotide pyrophosphorylase (carboxylating)|uniref:Probable nicotinate-nucleotide pyrophosphorylase [carboxylating] n=1 Tax=Priestia megaterium TaxID=1404 RepID=A0A6H1P937_PRIMG|nr:MULTISPECIES: carboxylating nicotinate-nucleotide diphosphorylase [Bacillaceae]MBT2697920.1 carboxylating nicotinate-nucleotide diphosphorylase [Bacillus sp. ISL-40]MBT2721490.1 carboxylating nicotinate-nucleotide diphosphorylase [Bacillus sp. ISL-46]MBT2727092.1 carboxylating nicotinate-nucleotide diphosphorylase [Bacillus sp. ISL-75]QIZ10053.1 carboxylating nicotinate-nucleotide diphosphorylase [Priestia megaterium]
MNTLKLRSQLEKFFMEDIGEQDITTDLIFGDSTNGEIVFLSKDDGVFCGEEIIKTGFQLLNNEISTQVFVKDGQSIKYGDKLAHVSGKIADLLKGERVILNLIQRMSGIATLTRQTVHTLDSGHTKVCDTRKTTPGLRMLEKYAVRTGGGFNHRFGLYDGVMIKDNHISFAGSITKAVEAIRKNAGHMVKVEVETETEAQVIEAVNAGADVIMFDNRTPDEIKELIKLVPANIITEASGGIQLANIADFRDTGVDYISLGYLTHSYKALDISVKVLWNKGDE